MGSDTLRTVDVISAECVLGLEDLTIRVDETDGSHASLEHFLRQQNQTMVLVICIHRERDVASLDSLYIQSSAQPTLRILHASIPLVFVFRSEVQAQ